MFCLKTLVTVFASEDIHQTAQYVAVLEDQHVLQQAGPDDGLVALVVDVMLTAGDGIEAPSPTPVLLFAWQVPVCP